MACLFLMPNSCYGNYGQGNCGGCPAALLCIDVAIAADGYYDELERREREAWEEEERTRQDAAYLDAMNR